ncbi:MAG: Hit-like protein involved in cell-cycle regulation [Candidatus Berkelbacteria bacterium Gr01-1014_85]|uniref:Hit-like protein involved in cell-cycle regulation n=1 Tax=Candidatus Berkelbacteria bacterium Gr01-1014_85 TaxID=2017150 RepID=A0A554JBF1_9BACT|nr:MAG: Hit-like protein involved in cell-cycle regulation [Candidatus Berkelbacteria bacterium Gr01-1014_85]
MDDCIFCKIIDRQVPGLIIAETDQAIVFVSRENHPLVVPKQHIKDIYELDEATGSALMTELIKTAKAVKKGLGCDGVYITQANEPAGGQEVFHLHFHVYPRWNDVTRNQVELRDDSERQITMEKVKAEYE